MAFCCDEAPDPKNTETISYTFPGQAPFTRILDRSQDTLLRDSGWVLGSTPASGVGGGATPPPELVTSYAYNPTDGRLETIRGGGLHPPSQFTYGYVPNSNLLATITGPAHTVTNTYEPNRDVLASKQNKAGTSVVSRYDYTVNALGQRSNVSQSGTAFAGSRDVTWGYDTLGQVTRADSTIPGLDRAYAFDMIGNRLKSADSLTLPVANNYSPNALNQYSSITNPQSAILNPLHDADGNMTSGPLPANVNANSTLVWDVENRLIQATVGTTGSVVRYSYDSQSRRIAETVGSTTKLTIYDGWNPIAEYAIQNSTFTIQNSYLWGIDLSGSMQGAGGVGGLLMTSLITNNSITSNYFPTYDGNGNVSEYLNESGEVSAHYEYDPFGKTTVATGPKANDFAHRFSTKPLDATTGLYYYGYRFYDPITGRWPSRDPIGEVGSSAWLELQRRCELVKKALWDEYASLGRPELGYYFAKAIRTVDSISKSPSEILGGPSRYAFLGNDAPNDIDRLGLIGYGGGGGGFGEKWDALWDAGIFDALEAKDIAKKTSKDARDTNLPGPHNGPQDAYRHCLWNCRMAKSVGQEDAKQIADNHEDHGNNPKDEEKMDRCNNREGRDCAKDPKRSCEDCCKDKLNDGTLQTLPPNRW